ncbi:MAG: glycosyltransferase family 39 protein [Phycisphaerales bacterium]|nr:MAG: glycosyltransferase family 39 protein [Phycisphaerales bacterium]
MKVESVTKNPERRSDIFNVLFLVLVASSLGIYLVATSVLISKDGVTYIELARRFQTDPLGVVKGLSFGYPFGVFAIHKLAGVFGADPSALGWTCSAQSVTLLCRVLALIPLYFMGKLLAGSKRSFWAIVILIILPYPAQFGSDALRDWPHILFLATGLWFLFGGARDGKWWMFGASGLVAGFGHMIRPECAQVLVYGVSWILMRLLVPEHNMKRPALVGAIAVLLLGFAIPAAPYMVARGRILPGKLKEYISASALREAKVNHNAASESGSNTLKASAYAGKTARAIGRLAGDICDNLMYYFVPALVVGAYARIRRKSEADNIERFFVPAFVFLNVLMMIMLYRYWGYISRRHCLPLVVLLVFYVPTGLEIFAQQLEQRFPKDRRQSNQPSQRWLFILLAVGVGICIPKLLSPLGLDKQGYRDAAEWLRLNSGPEDVVAVPDLRISFYAERKGIKYTTEISEGTDYIVRIVRDQDEQAKSDGAGREEYSARVDARKKNKKRVVVYRTM